MTEATGARRVEGIDLLKGLAIVGVMAQHGLPLALLADTWSDLHVRQAVPVFLVLMGFNAAGALRRSGRRRLSRLYARDYWAGRLQRLGLPFAITWVLAAVLALAGGELALGPTTLIGNLPLVGPGNYFVTVLATFALVFPALWWALQRHPWPALIACFAVDIGFELASPSFFTVEGGNRPYLYDGSLLRFLGAVALGVWLERARAEGRETPRWILALAPLSIAFLVLLDSGAVGSTGWSFLLPGFTQGTSVGAVFLAASVTGLGIAFMRQPQDRIARLFCAGVAQLGRASYQVFLLQIVWFGLLDEHSVATFTVGALGSGVTGWVFWWATRQPNRFSSILSARKRSHGKSLRTS